MDPAASIVASVFGSLAMQAAPLMIAPLASWLVTVAEKAPPIPYEGKTRTGIMTALAVAAFALNAALAWSSGNLDTVDWTHGAKLIVDSLTSAGVAAGGYAILWMGPRAAPKLRSSVIHWRLPC